MHAHLLEVDNVHGHWDARITCDATRIPIHGMRFPAQGESDLSKLPLDGMDVVIECTGALKTQAKLAVCFDACIR